MNYLKLCIVVLGLGKENKDI